MCRALPAQQMHQVLDALLQRDLQPLLQFNLTQPQLGQAQLQLGDQGCQFVVGRALWVGAKLHEVATAHQRELLLKAAAAAGEVVLSGGVLHRSASTMLLLGNRFVHLLHFLPSQLVVIKTILCSGAVLPAHGSTALSVTLRSVIT